MGNRSLPITRSSSACARLCTFGKRTRARKSEFIEDMVLIVGVGKKHARKCQETQTVSRPAERMSSKPM